MQMVMRIAGDRRVEEVGRAVRPVLDRDGRPRSVVGERHPADLACLRALFSRVPLSGVAEVVGGVPQRVVARGVNGVADHLPLGLGRGELGRQRYGFVRGEDEVESGVFADMLAPVLAAVSAACFEQGVELAVAGSGADACDAERRSEPRVHGGPPVCPFAPTCVVGGEALPGFEVATVERDAVDLEGFGLGRVLGHVGADRRAVARGGDFPEIEHRDQAWPAPLAGVLAWAVAAASAGVSRVRASLIWRSRAAMRDCWAGCGREGQASDGTSCSGRSGVRTWIIWVIWPVRASSCPRRDWPF